MPARARRTRTSPTPLTARQEPRHVAVLRFDLARARPSRIPTRPWASATLIWPGSLSARPGPPRGRARRFHRGEATRPASCRSACVPLRRRIGALLDAALRALYCYCEEHGVPILTHALHNNGFDKGNYDLAAPSDWSRCWTSTATCTALRALRTPRRCGRARADAGSEQLADAEPGPDRRDDHVYADVWLFEVRVRRDGRGSTGPAAVRPVDSADPMHNKRRRLMFGPTTG